MNDLTNSPEFLTQIIEPVKGWAPVQLRDLWSYHELLYYFVWKDLKVRYKQTILGVLWVILQPFLTMVVFTIFFGNLARVPSDGIPYPVFTFTALLPWQLFANSLSLAGNSLISNQALITKVYFPRLLLPMSAILTNLVDFLIAFIFLIGMMIYYGITPSVFMFTIPFLIIFAVITSLSVSLWLAALNVQFRDIRYTIPFLIQFWLFATPIVYPTSLIPENWKVLYGLNPMVGVVEGFRWALLRKADTPDITILISIFIVFILLISGLFYFKRMERTFSDII